MTYLELVKDICTAIDVEMKAVQTKLGSNGCADFAAYRFCNGQLDAYRKAKALALATLKKEEPEDYENLEDDNEFDH